MRAQDRSFLFLENLELKLILEVEEVAIAVTILYLHVSHCVNILFALLNFFFVAAPAAYGSSQDRD